MCLAGNFAGELVFAAMYRFSTLVGGGSRRAGRALRGRKFHAPVGLGDRGPVRPRGGPVQLMINLAMLLIHNGFIREDWSKIFHRESSPSSAWALRGQHGPCSRRRPVAGSCPAGAGERGLWPCWASWAEAADRAATTPYIMTTPAGCAASPTTTRRRQPGQPEISFEW